jgi:hypothetical protein
MESAKLKDTSTMVTMYTGTRFPAPTLTVSLNMVINADYRVSVFSREPWYHTTREATPSLPINLHWVKQIYHYKSTSPVFPCTFLAQVPVSTLSFKLPLSLHGAPYGSLSIFCMFSFTLTKSTPDYLSVTQLVMFSLSNPASTTLEPSCHSESLVM